MRPVVTAAEMRALDRATIDEVGLPGDRADGDRRARGRGRARGACSTARAATSRWCAGRATTAATASSRRACCATLGCDAVVYLAVARDKIARRRAGAPRRSSSAPAASCTMIDTPRGARRARRRDRRRRARGRRAVRRRARRGRSTATSPTSSPLINRRRARLAVDIPSGLDADTGRDARHRGRAPSARSRWRALKVALVSAPGFARCGEVEVADIGIPAALIAASSVARRRWSRPRDVARWLPRARALDHKGRRGHVLVVGGIAGHARRGPARRDRGAARRRRAVTLADGDRASSPRADSVMTRALEPARSARCSPARPRS